MRKCIAILNFFSQLQDEFARKKMEMVAEMVFNQFFYYDFVGFLYHANDLDNLVL